MHYKAIWRVTSKRWFDRETVIVEYQLVDRDSHRECPEGMTMTARRGRHVAPSVGDVFEVTTDMKPVDFDDPRHPYSDGRVQEPQ